MQVEVHEEKGDVGRGIGIAKAAVELDAVEDADVIGEADVSRMDVAVAVPDEAAGNPLSEKLTLVGQKVVHPVTDKLQVPFRYYKWREFGNLLKILFPIPADAFPAAEAVDKLAPLGVEMKICNGSRNPPDIAVGHLLSLKQPVEHSFIREPFHLYRIIYDLAFPVK